MEPNVVSVRSCLVLVGGCALACDRGFDEVPLDEAGGAFDGYQYHNAVATRGNAERGEPFPLTTCPRPQAMTGLSVTLDQQQLPVALTLLCAKVNADHSVAEATLGPTVSAERASLARDSRLLECAPGQVVVSLRGSLFPGDDEALFVNAIGIECATMEVWLREGGFAETTLQTGRSEIGSQNFVDGCSSGAAFVNGFSGRFSERLEQICVGCALRPL